MKFTQLFEPIKIGHLRLKNRIIFPPIATNLAWVSGEISDLQIFHYRRRAAGGAALIILENTCIAYPEARHGATQPRIDSDEFIPGLARLAQAVHDAGALISLELTHPGLNASLKFSQGMQPVAPSAISLRGDGIVPRELTGEEILKLVDRYAQAARRAQRAGFDLVELQGAHGLLINQFLSPLTNRRGDRYGGSRENRLRFVAEIVEQIRRLCGDGLPITMRLAADDLVEGGIGIAEGKALAQGLEELGISMIQADLGLCPPEKRLEPMAYPQGWRSYLAKALKEMVSIPVAAVGVIREPDFAEGLLQREETDLVVLGRALLADPDWPRKAQAGEAKRIRKCIGCSECIRARHHEDRSIRCGVNAMVGRDEEFAHLGRSEEPKRIIVLGGGPAGMEAARVAALRGHRVDLYDEQERLGGSLLIGSRPPGKGKLGWLAEYYQAELPRLGVKIHLGQKLTAEAIRSLKPDALILAPGGRPLIPQIPGIKGENVVTAQEVLRGDVPVGGKQIIVAGGGLVGCETAEHLATQGKSVTIVEMLPKPAQDMEPISRGYLLSRLEELGVEIRLNTTLLAVKSGGIIVQTSPTSREEMPAELLVLALGLRSNEEWREVSAQIPTYPVGDCIRPGKIVDAIREGYIVGKML